MDITKELMKLNFQFKSKAGYKYSDPNVTRYLVFNRFEDNVSIIGYMSFRAIDNKVTYKINRVDMRNRNKIDIKEAKATNVELDEARAAVLDLVTDNKILFL